ncbi:MAG: hypothetical protein WDO16_04065 [Bacteroidota bacterium]
MAIAITKAVIKTGGYDRSDSKRFLLVNWLKEGKTSAIKIKLSSNAIAVNKMIR